MLTEVASLTDQRRVADCPRSIELGSAGNCAITGAFAGVGGGGGTTGGGAGGGGAAAPGALFFHPPAHPHRQKPLKIRTPLSVSHSGVPSSFEFLLAPNRHLVPALGG